MISAKRDHCPSRVPRHVMYNDQNLSVCPSSEVSKEIDHPVVQTQFSGGTNMSCDESCQSSSSEGMSSNTQFSNSTPLKANSRSGARLSATKERYYLNNPEVDDQFVENFFVALDVVPNVENDSIAQSIKTISSVHGELNMYSELVQVFNKIAQSVCAASSPITSPLHFLCSHTKGPSSKNLQQTRRIAPDIFVLPPLAVSKKFLQKMESKDADSSDPSFRCPWSVLESMVEVKPDKQWKNKQAVDYLETILQHRPDKANVLGISCNQVGYRFYYVDACTQKTSIAFLWEDGLTKLVHYVYSLHRIFTEDIKRDTSIRLHDIIWKGKYSSAIWGISFKGEEYEIRPIFERKGLGRRTWIAVGTINHTDDIENAKSESDVRVMKDMWRDNSRRYKEGSLLQRIHENGFVPGVVRPIVDSAFDDLTTRNRTKHRLIMGSTGLRLSACKSVLEFLKVIYDAIESHERVVARGVLHRDISWYNVLCRPRHYIGNENILDHPSIGKILEEPDPQPLCLLTDFDNAALVQDDKDPGEGTKRTGTPMFMACELAYERTCYDLLRSTKPSPSITLLQFSLEGETLRNYTSIHGLERYEEYNTLLTSVISGHVAEVDPFAAGNLVPSHQPHHDMESIYWIILWFLAKALPSGTEAYPAKGNVLQRSVLEVIHSRMTPDHKPDSVINILTRAETVWKLYLHPAFHSLAKMLFNMGDYICMCWSRFPHMPFWHSHEAFKRLLLKEIVRMSKDETPIPIQGPKPPLPRARSGFPADTGKPSLKMTAIRNLTPSGSGSQVRGSSESRQSGKTTKRARSNSISASSGSIAKKQRSNSLHGSMGNALDTDIVNDDFVSVCLENIEEDDIAWFTL